MIRAPKSKMTVMIYSTVVYLEECRIRVSNQEYILRDNKCFLGSVKGWGLYGKVSKRAFCRYDDDNLHTITLDKKYYIDKDCILYTRDGNVIGLYNPLTNEIGNVLKSVIKTPGSALQVGMFSNPRLVEQCVEETARLLEEKPTVKLFGKDVRQPRSVGFFSDKHSTMEGKPLTDGLKELLRIVNESFPMGNFNCVLVNTYQNGLDNIGKHRDNEKQSSPVGVVTISYGAVRKFRIRDKAGKIVLDVPTLSGSIMWMQGDFQKEFTHEITVEKKVKTSRTSFTFRSHV